MTRASFVSGCAGSEPQKGDRCPPCGRVCQFSRIKEMDGGRSFRPLNTSLAFTVGFEKCIYFLNCFPVTLVFMEPS